MRFSVVLNLCKLNFRSVCIFFAQSHSSIRNFFSLPVDIWSNLKSVITLQCVTFTSISRIKNVPVKPYGSQIDISQFDFCSEQARC